jgi:hypothetical protein
VDVDGLVVKIFTRPGLPKRIRSARTMKEGGEKELGKLTSDDGPSASGVGVLLASIAGEGVLGFELATHPTTIHSMIDQRWRQRKGREAGKGKEARLAGLACKRTSSRAPTDQSLARGGGHPSPSFPLLLGHHLCGCPWKRRTRARTEAKPGVLRSADEGRGTGRPAKGRVGWIRWQGGRVSEACQIGGDEPGDGCLVESGRGPSLPNSSGAARVGLFFSHQPDDEWRV